MITPNITHRQKETRLSMVYQTTGTHNTYLAVSFWVTLKISTVYCIILYIKQQTHINTPYIYPGNIGLPFCFSCTIICTIWPYINVSQKWQYTNHFRKEVKWIEYTNKVRYIVYTHKQQFYTAVLLSEQWGHSGSFLKEQCFKHWYLMRIKA